MNLTSGIFTELCTTTETSIPAGLVHLPGMYYLFPMSNMENLHHLERQYHFTDSPSFTFKVNIFIWYNFCFKIFFRIDWLVMETHTHTFWGDAALNPEYCLQCVFWLVLKFWWWLSNSQPPLLPELRFQWFILPKRKLRCCQREARSGHRESRLVRDSIGLLVVAHLSTLFLYLTVWVVPLSPC